MIAATLFLVASALYLVAAVAAFLALVPSLGPSLGLSLGTEDQERRKRGRDEIIIKVTVNNFRKSTVTTSTIQVE